MGTLFSELFIFFLKNIIIVYNPVEEWEYTRWARLSKCHDNFYTRQEENLTSGQQH